jgi:inosine-uridine nucleoside N-ribohydrolase
LILDTDPGCDDSLFIACCISSVYLLRQKKIDIEIRGITIVYGNNNSVEILARAAARILLECKVDTKLKEVLSDNFKLVMGNSLPGKDSPGTFVHGKFGLGNVNPDENDEWKSKIDAFLKTYGSPRKTKNNDAAEFIKKTLKEASENNEKIYILAVGPLTNISDTFNLLTDDPDGKIQSNLKELVIMGGSVGMGNTAPLVEANWMNDPSAVHNVLTIFKGKITWVPLNFTHQLNIIRVVEYFKEIIPQKSENVDLLQLFCNIFERYIEALTGKIVKVIKIGNGEQISIRLFDTTIGYKTKFSMDDKSIYDKVFLGEKLTDDLFPNGIEQYGLPLHDGSAMLAFFFDDMIEFKERYISIDINPTTYNWGSPEYATEVAGKVHMFKEQTYSSPQTYSLPLRKVNLAYQPKKMPSGIEDIHTVFVNLILYLNKKTALNTF